MNHNSSTDGRLYSGQSKLGNLFSNTMHACYAPSWL